MMYTHIENFPPELWLEIFRFLTSDHIAGAFGNLNSFFDFLLASSHLPTIFRVKIDGSHAYPIPTRFGLEKNIKLEWIQALNANARVDQVYVVQFLRYHASRLISLRSLNVSIRAKKAASNLDYLCKALSQLHSLQVFQLKCTRRYVAKTLSASIAELIKAVLQLPFLHHCTLDFWNLQENNFDREYITDLPSNYSIEYLTINNVDRRIFHDIVSYCHG
jgi:hypothetical protein